MSKILSAEAPTVRKMTPQEIQEGYLLAVANTLEDIVTLPRNKLNHGHIGTLYGSAIQRIQAGDPIAEEHVAVLDVLKDEQGLNGTLAKFKEELNANFEVWRKRPHTTFSSPQLEQIVAGVFVLKHTG
jgi:hypothetical protein